MLFSQYEYKLKLFSWSAPCLHFQIRLSCLVCEKMKKKTNKLLFSLGTDRCTFTHIFLTGLGNLNKPYFIKQNQLIIIDDYYIKCAFIGELHKPIPKSKSHKLMRWFVPQNDKEKKNRIQEEMFQSFYWNQINIIRKPIKIDLSMSG